MLVVVVVVVVVVVAPQPGGVGFVAALHVAFCAVNSTKHADRQA
jgi:uncharacterized membrane protein YbhN (UPF0104 family)